MTLTKEEYVRGQGQTRAHHCHWPGCSKQVPPARWGCASHWFRLPQKLRNAIWASYRPGQEITGDPSSAYLQAAAAVQRWIQETDHAPRTVQSHDSRGNRPDSAPAALAQERHRPPLHTPGPFVLWPDATEIFCADCDEEEPRTSTQKLIDTSTGEIIRLCGNHGAAASHRHGIPHHVFNPTGARTP